MLLLLFWSPILLPLSISTFVTTFIYYLPFRPPTEGDLPRAPPPPPQSCRAPGRFLPRTDSKPSGRCDDYYLRLLSPVMIRMDRSQALRGPAPVLLLLRPVPAQHRRYPLVGRGARRQQLLAELVGNANPRCEAPFRGSVLLSGS